MAWTWIPSTNGLCGSRTCQPCRTNSKKLFSAAFRLWISRACWISCRAGLSISGAAAGMLFDALLQGVQFFGAHHSGERGGQFVFLLDHEALLPLAQLHGDMFVDIVHRRRERRIKLILPVNVVFLLTRVDRNHLPGEEAVLSPFGSVGV